ncbi:MAG: NAD(P)/FAD-dependent oxidoreductase [Alphaproteobacteria bacterium]|nr:NAD(P)/FAD-dependent oxidoreductase [Alphaproteobacteria bacterium]
MQNFDAIIVGGGAAGLMCALSAAARGRKILLLEHNKSLGAKILISGGGRCNFTNQDVVPTAYLSQNPHFAKSALSRFTQWDFISLIAAHGVTWHEKTLGQLFCDQGAKRILKVLTDECAKNGVTIETGVAVEEVSFENETYKITCTHSSYSAPRLVVATGGLSIPKMGATGFAYDVARQFGLKVEKTEAALVPFTFAEGDLAFMKPLAGVAADAIISCGNSSFREALLFTHRGLSGPSVLQISSYWHAGETLVVNLLPNTEDGFAWLRDAREARPKLQLKTLLAEILPARLAEAIAEPWPGALGGLSNKDLQAVADRCCRWKLVPSGTEGFKKAEVTRGGVSTAELSSKTMEAKKQPGLYFIGECVDVTGWLGGYNFQWAWSSGWAAAQYL